MTLTLSNQILKELLDNNTLSDIKDWAVNKIDLLHESDRHKNAKALEQEFEEWIHIPEEVQEIDIMYIDISALNDRPLDKP
jgi:hypothetical protein